MVGDFLCRKMTELGGERPWALVASGPNSGFPHYHGNQRIIEDQDILLLDFGCSYHQLQADMTRTVFIGSATKEQKKVYDYDKNT